MSNKTLAAEILSPNGGVCKCKLTVDDESRITALSVKPSTALPLNSEDMVTVVGKLIGEAESELHVDLKPATRQSQLEAKPKAAAKGSD